MSNVPEIEFLRCIGFNTTLNSLHVHATENTYIHAAGGTVVSTGLNAQEQELLNDPEMINVTISCIAVSKSGRYISVGYQGLHSDILLWNYETKTLVSRLAEHDHGIQSLDFSHDDRLLISIGNENPIRLFIWDINTSSIVSGTTMRPDMILSVVSWGGMYRSIKRRDTQNYQFCTAGKQNLSLWSLNPYEGKLESIAIENLNSMVRDYRCIAFSVDKENVYAGSTTGDIAIIYIKTMRIVQSLTVCNGNINVIKCCPGYLFVGGGGADGYVVVYNTPQHEEISRIRLNAPVTSLSIFPSRNNETIIGTVAGDIYRANLSPMSASPTNDKPGSGNKLRLQLMPLQASHTGAVTKVAFCMEYSDRFATVSGDGFIRIWDAGDYSVLLSSYVPTKSLPSGLCYTADLLVTSWLDGVIRCHSAESGDQLWTIPDAHVHGVTSIMLSNNQRFILSGGQSGDMRLWDTRKRELISHFKEHTGSVTDLQISSDDIHAISCSRDRCWYYWDLQHEKRISGHIQPMGGMNGHILGKNGNVVLTIGQEKRITMWDINKEQPIQMISHQDEALCIAKAHSLDLFATGSAERTLRLWKYSTRELIAQHREHSGAILSIAFSPDDRQLVSVGQDGKIILWNIYLPNGSTL